MQRIKIIVDGVFSANLADDESLNFTLAGMKKFLEEAEVREDYVEGLFGAEVCLPPALILRYAKDAKIEVVNE